MPDEFFIQRNDNHPKIYGYTELSKEFKGLIKIGYTQRKLSERMKEHFKTEGPNNIKRYKVLF